MQNNKKKVDNICVLRTSSLGDICHMLPFIYTLKSEYPKANITWVIGKEEAKFLNNIDGVEFIIFDKSNTLKSYFCIAKVFKKVKYDILFIMQVSLRANIISLFVNSKTKVGYDNARASDLHSFFSNTKITSSPHSHVVDVFLSFLSILNIDTKNYIYKWDVNEKISKKDLFKKFPKLNDKYFVISPCSRSSNRNWIISRYAELADYINNKFGIQCVFSSSNSDYEKNFVSEITSKMKSSYLNLSGLTNVHDLLTLVKHSEFLISPDSGPIHIATCVDKPVFGLYGVTNIIRAGPYNSKALCVDKYNDALLKFENKKPEEVKWRFKNNHKDVMSLISTEDVIEKINNYFTSRRVS